MGRQERLAALSVAMVLLGLTQAVWGLEGGELLYAGLGVVYAAIGVGFYAAEE